ncbi:MAG: ribonuclease domain-containing protein [Eubacteriales bacterium]|nr:ribonuclease domain-containing protein [Eubacteriales bacterium]MDD3883126.1 ribonuclease domain-containing protein [Eubacteriales bacterium]MDD4512704.1 ribonuclease domain-containing protein [Eubacteriales bacterium]
MSTDRDGTKRINKKTPLLTTLLALLLIVLYYITNPGGLKSASAPQVTEAPAHLQETLLVEESGKYSDKQRVALYLHLYGRLPSNYITKEEARNLGWDSSENTLAEVAPGMSIGGDRYGNYEELLPVKKGVTYKECDIDYASGSRNAKRIVYSNTGWIYYTDDHYESFQTLYEGAGE